MSICAPDRKDKGCFTLEELIELCKAYNRYITKNKLSPYPNKLNNSKITLIQIKNNRDQLLNDLKKRFKDICSDELCITKQEFMNEIVPEMSNIVNNAFRPEGPGNPIEWLSTSDIDGIMKQYEKVYSDFLFLGAVPSDCHKHSFCSLSEMNSIFEKNKVGIIYNLDGYGYPGSHWIAIFINVPKGEMYYCDSTGAAPNENIQEFIDNLSNFYKNKMKKEIKFRMNSKGYQKDGSECGVYSCNFIIRMLSGESFDSIIHNSLSFKEINSCRNVYFRNKPSKYSPNELCDPE
jgi:hypothetical protein